MTGFSLNKKKTVTPTGSTAEQDIWKIEHISGNEITIILLDGLPSKFIQSDMQIVQYLQNIINNTGLQSYVITSAMNIKRPQLLDDKTNPEMSKEKRTLGLVDYYRKHDSDWYEKIVLPYREKGFTVNTVLAFGASFYSILGSSEDINLYDLYFPYLNNYVYQGHGFEGDRGMFSHQKVKDMFVYPMFPLDDIFIPSKDTNYASTKVELGTWKLRYMVIILKRIVMKTYKLPVNMDPCNLVDVVGKEEVIKFCDSHCDMPEMAIDTETSGLNYLDCFIRCVQVAFDENTGYFMEWEDVKDPEVFPHFVKMITTAKCVVAQNGKFDVKFLWQNGVPQTFEIDEDAMESGHVLCSDRHVGLKTTAYMCTPYGGYDNQLDTWRAKQAKLRGIPVDDVPYSDAPHNVLLPYATMDPIITMRNHHQIMRDLAQFEAEHKNPKPLDHTDGHYYTPTSWYKNYVMPLYRRVCKVEFNGMFLDEEVMNKHRTDLQNQEKEKRQEIAKIFKEEYGMDVSPDYEFTSTQKLGILLQKAGWPCHGLDKTGKYYQTDDTSFAEWKRDGMKGAKELEKLRQIVNGYRTYIGVEETSVDKKTGRIKKETTGWLQYARHHPDGTYRIHCNFGVCMNTTFRCRSSEPNFQNIPTRGEVAEMVKQCISVPPADMYYLTGNSGKTYEAAEVEYVHVKNHPSGQPYVEARFLNGLENTDCEIDETEPVVMDFESGSEFIKNWRASKWQ